MSRIDNNYDNLKLPVSGNFEHHNFFFILFYFNIQETALQERSGIHTQKNTINYTDTKPSTSCKNRDHLQVKMQYSS